MNYWMIGVAFAAYSLACAYWCWRESQRRREAPYTAVTLGLLFGVIGVIFDGLVFDPGEEH